MNVQEPTKKIAVLSALFALLGPLEDGCSGFAACDPGQELKAGLCLASGGSPPSGDAGSADAGEPPTCGADAAATGEFGRACTAHSECACPAPVCAIQPGEKSGYCTQIDCNQGANACPAGFQCVDLSVLDPSYPFTCLKNG